jgi:hypothetical protein
VGPYASGVKEIHYILDGTETVVTGHTAQFTIPLEGNHTLEFWAIDNLDNEGAHTTQMHIVDNSAPTVSSTVVGPRVGAYINVNSTIEVTAEDTGCGVKEIHYIVEYPDASSIAYIVPGSMATITFDESCNHSVDIWAVDHLDNAGVIQSQTYHVDNTPPLSTVSLSPYEQDAPVNLSIAASDAGCNGGVGIKSVELWYRQSTDNATWGGWTLYSTDSMAPYDLSFTAPLGTGYYQFHTIAVDKLYNREAQPVTPDAIAYLFGDVTYTISLAQGWNLITIPVEHNLTAESLGAAIPFCDTVTKWDAAAQGYVNHPVGTAIEVFALEDGVSYFVHVTNDSQFTVTGEPLDTIAVAVMPGWNLLGWVRTHAVTAEQLGDAVNGSDTVMRWSTTVQDYIPHPMGTTINNFDVTHGMGLFVHAIEESIWDGEAEGA